MGSARWLAVATVALLLTGCVGHSAPPAGGLSAEEEAEYLAVLAAARGGPKVEAVPSAGWGTVITGCMNAAGYLEFSADSVSVDDAGVASFTMRIGDGVGQAEQLATCLTRYPILPTLDGSANLAQLDYLYDYYRDFLVPCLAAEGYDNLGAVPTREQFVVISAEPHWTPLVGIPQSALDDGSLLETCPASPFAGNVRF